MLSHNIRVLVVDDDPIIALMMESMLDELGYWVVGPDYNLRDGVDRATNEEIDFAVLDFDLGHGTDVMPIVAILTRRQIPFVIATGNSEASIHLQLPGATVLAKPVIGEELEKVLP